MLEITLIVNLFRGRWLANSGSYIQLSAIPYVALYSLLSSLLSIIPCIPAEHVITFMRKLFGFGDGKRSNKQQFVLNVTPDKIWLDADGWGWRLLIRRGLSGFPLQLKQYNLLKRARGIGGGILHRIFGGYMPLRVITIVSKQKMFQSWSLRVLLDFNPIYFKPLDLTTCDQICILSNPIWNFLCFFSFSLFTFVIYIYPLPNQPYPFSYYYSRKVSPRFLRAG